VEQYAPENLPENRPGHLGRPSHTELPTGLGTGSKNLSENRPSRTELPTGFRTGSKACAGRAGRTQWPWTCLVVAVLAAVAIGAAAWSSSSHEAGTSPAPRPAHSLRPAPPTLAELSADEPQPRVLVEENEHDFGFVQPWEDCHHTFVLRNVGDAPSTLKVDSTTCVCTVGGLSSSVLYPGGKVRAAVTVKPKINEEVFCQSATIRTQDPENERITLRVSGAVRKMIEAAPPHLEFTNLRPGQSASDEVVVFSQVWDGFRIARVTPSRPEVTCRVELAPEATLSKLGARCGHRLIITIPGSLPAASFAERIQLAIEPEEGMYKPQELVVEVRGRIAVSVSLDGPRLNVLNVLQLGQLRTGQGARAHVTMKVRDEPRDVQIKEIRSKPDFLRVRVSPYVAAKPQLGLYRIDVEVPSDAPPANFTGDHPGEIEIQTDHPHIPTVRLKVQFAVASRAEDDLR